MHTLCNEGIECTTHFKFMVKMSHYVDVENAINVKVVVMVLYYIGETNNLRKRTTLHNQHIRHENLRMIL